MLLSTYALGRDNNLNLIRFVSASAVLISHSYPLALGRGNADPLQGLVGISIGEVAVDIFFVTSGFLVAGSLFNRGRTLDFVLARALRIIPALLVLVLLTVFGLGLLFTTSDWSSYWNAPETQAYLLKNSTMLFGGTNRLPGVFEANPFDGAVNGSLWTLTWELRMYAILAALWMVLKVFGAARARYAGLGILVLAGFGLLMNVAPMLAQLPLFRTDTYVNLARFVLTFFLGGAFYVLRAQITMRPAIGAASIAIFALGATFGVGHLAYYLALPYLVLYLAYLPGGAVRHFNRAGDYSYGIYIYAFPVQQSLAALSPGISVWSMTALAWPLTLLLAWFSWHLVERPALDSKARIMDKLRARTPGLPA